MEYVFVELIDSNLERTGEFTNIIVERNLFAENDDDTKYKLEKTGELVTCLRKENGIEKEFELVKDGTSQRFKTLGTN